MKKRSILVLALVASVSFAEVYDWGIRNTKDEFTGVETCHHLVTNSEAARDGVAMSKVDGHIHMTIMRALPNWDDISTFSAQGKEGNEKVYFTIGDEIKMLEPTEVEGLKRKDLDVAHFWYLEPNHYLLTKLLSAPQDVQVKFVGRWDHLEADFTIKHGVIVKLNEGFVRTCMK